VSTKTRFTYDAARAYAVNGARAPFFGLDLIQIKQAIFGVEFMAFVESSNRIRPDLLVTNDGDDFICIILPIQNWTWEQMFAQGGSAGHESRAPFCCLLEAALCMARHSDHVGCQCGALGGDSSLERYPIVALSTMSK
jgi:hypothetical protein